MHSKDHLDSYQNQAAYPKNTPLSLLASDLELALLLAQVQ
jgi:hypothetical protein